MAIAGITASKSEARRAIAGGGAYLNNVKVTEPDAVPRRATCCTAGSWCYGAGSARSAAWK